jgi:hypothetical protein
VHEIRDVLQVFRLVLHEPPASALKEFARLYVRGIFQQTEALERGRFSMIERTQDAHIGLSVSVWIDCG